MNILKARLDHATNSSSTHSIIKMGPGKRPKDTVVDHEFGWDHFTASSKDSKDAYFSILLEGALADCFGYDIAAILVKDLTGKDTSEGYVDHDSVFGFPHRFDKDVVDMEFAKEFREWLLRDEVLILGGNDNTEIKHPLLERYDDLGFSKHGMSTMVCRKDRTGHWTLYSRYTGAKVRISFTKKEAKRSVFPELIDIKITDFCASNCIYCYQQSTPRGIHGNSAYLQSVAYLCSQMKVFEVAIGGGEPTSHPDFVDILESFRNRGIVPNFSTRSLHWLKDPAKAHQISNLCGAWALSVDYSREIIDAYASAKHMGVKQPTIHVVLGANPLYRTEDIIKVAASMELKVVLLGFKTVGRGKIAKQYDTEGWIDLIEKYNCRTSIDTSVAAVYEKELEAADVSEYLLERQEGCHSMYIDAVNQMMGPSSFCPTINMMPLDEIGYNGTSLVEKAMNSWND